MTLTKKMQVVYCDDGLLHNPLNEMTGGEWKAYVGKVSLFFWQLPRDKTITLTNPL